MAESDKEVIRRLARAARAGQPDKDTASCRILERATDSREYRLADRVLFYVHVRDEVRTRMAIRRALPNKLVTVPYCAGDRLKLFWLTDWTQLTPGRYGVLEPRRELQAVDRHRIQPEEIDLALAPGVAFDRQGNRMGHGKGFYDRLLAQMPRSTVLIGLAYDCQVFPRLTIEPHDIPMDRVLTQSQVYQGRGRE